MSSGWPFEMWPGGPPPGAYLQGSPESTPKLTPEQHRVRGEQLDAYGLAYDHWTNRAIELLAEVDNPIARLAVAVRASLRSRTGHGPTGSALTILADVPVLKTLMPNVTWNQSSLRGQDWDHDAIARWFTEAVRVEPNCPRLLVGYVPVLGIERRRPVWGFHEGSSRVGQTDSTQSFCWVGVSTKGERLFGSVQHRTVPLAPGEGFNALALAEMADFAKLPDLGDKPPDPRFFGVR
jgi:hypothetical protein